MKLDIFGLKQKKRGRPVGTCGAAKTDPIHSEDASPGRCDNLLP